MKGGKQNMNEIEINAILALICLVIIVSVGDPIYNSIIKNNSKGEKNHGNTK